MNIKNTMRSLFGFVIATTFGFVASAASLEKEIEKCGSSDAVCVGKVLLKATSGSGTSADYVYYYHSDSCVDDRL